MKKVIILFSLSAIALTIGLSSCQEEKIVEKVVTNTDTLTIRDTINTIHIDSFFTVDPNSVYADIGRQYAPYQGYEAIGLVVDKFLVNVVGDTRINARFSNANASYLRNMLIDQVCQATGGPCQYKGMNMRDAHTSATGKEGFTGRMYGNSVKMITNAEFTALVEDLIAAMDTYALNASSKNAILSVLGGMQSDIVGNP